MAFNLSDFKTARRWNGLNRFFQVAFSITLVLGLNYLASQTAFQGRWNLGEERRQTLSLETRKYLESIANRAPKTEDAGQPWVRVYATLSEEGLDAGDVQLIRPLARQLRHLLEDFSHQANQVQRTRGWLGVESADRIKNARLWSELSSRLAPIDYKTALVVVCDNGAVPRYKYIDLADLVRVGNNARGAELDAFRGEEVLISALLSVTEDKSPVVYMTTGHGEMSPLDISERGLSSLDVQLRARNLEVKQLDLSKFNEVPTNADLVLIPSPLTEFSAQDVEKLRRYMRERNGRMIVLVDVGARNGLDDLFYDWGILVDDVRVWDVSPQARDPGNDLLLRAGGREHALTQMLRSEGVVLAVGQARAVRFDMGGPMDDTLQVFEVVGTSSSTQAWGERDYQRQPFEFNLERGDLLPPVSAAAVAERVVGRKQNISIPGGRLLVFGSGDVAANLRLNKVANSYFVLNAVNWMLDRDQFLNIPPRPLSQFQLKATSSDLNRVAKRFLLLPGAMLLLGMGVFFWRRST